MSAWTTGIGLGLEAARMQQQRDQFAQEQAFRQQQAAINNAQQDRQFQAAQTADVRDFDAMQQWRAFQQDQVRQQVAERKAALDRDLMGQQATAQVFKAIAAPDITTAPGGVGPIQPHPADTLDDNTLMNASPQALHAYVGARQNRAALQKRRQFGINQVEQARADGSIKLVDPRTAQEWADLGLYADGTIRPDEMPVSMAKQREQQHEAMAQYLAMEQDAAGNYTSNPQVYETYKRVPFEMLKPAYEMKSRHDQAIEVARIRQATQQNTAAFKASTAGLSQTNRNALAAVYGKLAKDLDKKPEQAYSRQQYTEARSAAIMGNVLPDGAVVLKDGAVNKQGFIELVHPDGSIEGVAPQEFERRYVQQQGGLLDTADQTQAPTPTDLAPDEDAILNAFRQKHGREPHQGDIDELEAIGSSMTAGG